MIEVSVIMPLFNCERYVAQAVQSVLSQRQEGLELIVVNDGSTDRSIDALLPYRDRLSILEQDNAGAAAARNAGMRVARGCFIAFLDADDWWYPSRLAAQLAAAEHFPDAAMFFTDFSVVDEAGVERIGRGIRPWYGVFRDASATSWGRVYSRSATLRFVTPDGSVAEARGFAGRVGEWLFAGNFINTSSVLLKRSCMERIGYFNLCLTTEEDYEYWLRVANEWELAFVDAALVARRRRPGQLTDASRLEVVVRNALTVVERAASRMQPVVTPAQVRRRLGRLHQTLGVICLRSSRNSEARRHLLKSTRVRPGDLASWLLLALAVIPVNVLRHLERLSHSLRRRDETDVQAAE